MSFDHRSDTRKPAVSQPSADRAGTPGKQTLTSTIDATSSASSTGVSTGKAEYGAADLRASIGNLAEGSQSV